MFKRIPFRNDFWLMTLAGAVLVLLVIVLGIGFFNAIYSTQLESRKDFLTQQTALAARGLEIEVERFKSETNTLMAYLVDPDMDSDDYREELTTFTRRIFNSFPKMIENVWIDFGDSTLVFSLTERNDFIRKRKDGNIPRIDQKGDFISLQEGNFRIVYELDLPGFAADYVSSFYLEQGGGKFLLLNDILYHIDRIPNSSQFRIDKEDFDQVKAEVDNGLKGLHEVRWIDAQDHIISGILVQYPFNFSPSKGVSSLIFIVPTENLTTGIYSTFLFIFIAIALLLICTVVFFAISLRNNLESQKLHEENLREISTLFDQQNLLMRELRGFMFFHDALGEMIQVSDEVEEVLGHSKGEFEEAFKIDSTHPEAVELKRRVKDSLAEHSELIDFEYDFTKPSGELLRLRIFSKMIYSESGRFEGGLGLCTDITTQYQAREEIIQSENRMRTLIQNIPDTIFIFDNHGEIMDFHVQEGKPSWVEESDLMGKSIANLVPEEQLVYVINAFDLAKKHKNIQTIEILKQTLRGEKHLEMRIFPLDDNLVMSITKDITGQKIWEKGLVEAMNAADKASRAKSEFLANMSHEIRTPMNGLLGIIDLLEGTKLDRIQKQYVDIIKNSGNSLLNIIRDILDYSKIEAGEIEIHTVAFDPIKELQAQVEILSGVAKKKRINLKVSNNLKGNVLLEGDKNKINQVLLNLIGNALKFTPEKGKVNVKMELDGLDGQLLFLTYSVRDSGIGITEENILNLTKPFYQVDSSTSRSFQGTGLGLAIAKKIIELLGGELIIESELGKGSEFKFTVLVKSTDQKIENFEHQELSWKDVKEMGAAFPLKILLAEDNELNIQLMTLMFEQLGFQFEIAKNGQEALEMVIEKEFDVILMDVQMPIMNGLETTREIRKLNNRADLIIIGLSANVFEEDQKEAMQAGMNDYLTKPIRLALLADKLEYYFRKTREKKEQE